MEEEKMEEEKNEEQEAAEEGENNKGLHAIERSNLRGARGQSTPKKKKSATKRKQKQSTGERVIRQKPKRKKKSGSSGKKGLILILLIAIAVLFLLTTIFATAQMNLQLASSTVSVDGVFQSVREPAQSKDISYRQLGPFDVTHEKPITNVTRERRNTRAEGTATIYNVNPSGESLDLINYTRLQSEDGRIYRIRGKQVIPGGKTVNGTFVPGSKEVKIDADDFGNEFNLPEKGVRLSVPGLSKHQSFSDTYAMTTSKIVGGFHGEQLIPNKDEEAQIRQQLRKEIENDLRDRLAQSVEHNSISERVVFENGIFILFDSLENTQSGDAVIVKEKGTLYAVSFRETELAALLAKYAPAAVQSVQPARVEIQDLSMEIEKRDEFDIISSTELGFRLQGSANLFWDIDTALFTSDIAGKSREEITTIITSEYPQITQHNIVRIFPPWRSKIPTNKGKIEIELEYENPGE